MAAAEVDRQVRETAKLLHIEHLLDRLPGSCPAASSSAWRSPARWSSARPCCCSTSRWSISTTSCARSSAPSCATCSRASETTVVYATTEPLEALIMGGEVIVMDEGRVLQTGATVAGLSPAGLAAGRRRLQRPADEHAVRDGRGRGRAWAQRLGDPADRPSRARSRPASTRWASAPTTCRFGDGTRASSRSTPRSSSPRFPARRPSSTSATAICTGWCRRRACTSTRCTSRCRSISTRHASTHSIGGGTLEATPARVTGRGLSMARIDFEAVAHAYVASIRMGRRTTR